MVTGDVSAPMTATPQTTHAQFSAGPAMYGQSEVTAATTQDFRVPVQSDGQHAAHVTAFYGQHLPQQQQLQNAHEQYAPTYQQSGYAHQVGMPAQQYQVAHQGGMPAEHYEEYQSTDQKNLGFDASPWSEQQFPQSGGFDIGSGAQMGYGQQQQQHSLQTFEHGQNEQYGVQTYGDLAMAAMREQQIMQNQNYDQQPAVYADGNLHPGSYGDDSGYNELSGINYGMPDYYDPSGVQPQVGHDQVGGGMQSFSGHDQFQHMENSGFVPHEGGQVYGQEIQPAHYNSAFHTGVEMAYVG